jgi:hypothetical protein
MEARWNRGYKIARVKMKLCFIFTRAIFIYSLNTHYELVT